MARPLAFDHSTDERKHEFAVIYNVIVDTYLARIGPSAFALYCTLVRLANRDQECWPGLSYLERLTGLSRHTILKAISTLVDAGLIAVLPQPNRRSNLYLIANVKGQISGSAEIAPLLPKLAKNAPNSVSSVDTALPDNGRVVQKMPGGGVKTARGSAISAAEVVQKMHPNKTESLNNNKEEDSLRTTTQPVRIVAEATTRLEVKKPVVVYDKFQDCDTPEQQRADACDRAVERLGTAGVSTDIARSLVDEHGAEACLCQIEAIAYRKHENRAAVLVTSIRQHWTMPPELEKAKLDRVTRTKRAQEARTKAEDDARTTALRLAHAVEQQARWDSLSPAERALIEHQAREKLSPIMRRRLNAQEAVGESVGMTIQTTLLELQRKILAERAGELEVPVVA